MSLFIHPEAYSDPKVSEIIKTKLNNIINENSEKIQQQVKEISLSECLIEHLSLDGHPPHIQLLNIQQAPTKNEVQQQQANHQQNKQNTLDAQNKQNTLKQNTLKQNTLKQNTLKQNTLDPQNKQRNNNAQNKQNTLDPSHRLDLHGLSRGSRTESVFTHNTTADDLFSMGSSHRTGSVFVNRFEESYVIPQDLKDLSQPRYGSNQKTIIGTQKRGRNIAPGVNAKTLELPKKKEAKYNPLKDIVDLGMLGEGVMIRALVKWNSTNDTHIRFRANIGVNIPVPNFIELPITVSLSKIRFSAEIVVIYRVETHSIECFIENNSNFKKPRFELAIEFGSDASNVVDGEVLVDKKKIRGFLREHIHYIIDNALMFPKVLSIDLPDIPINFPSQSKDEPVMPRKHKSRNYKERRYNSKVQRTNTKPSSYSSPRRRRAGKNPETSPQKNSLDKKKKRV